MRRYIVDASAWIDYFRGTSRGRRVRQLIRPPGKPVEIFTPTVVLAEMQKHYAKEDQPGFDQDMTNVQMISKQLPVLDCETAVRAGQLLARHDNKGMGIVDCILLAVAESNHGKVLTLDSHFKGRREAIYIGGRKELS